MALAIYISLAFLFGFLARAFGLPSLIGYLIAGFTLHALPPMIEMSAEVEKNLAEVAHLGVLLLMFTIGLKLRPSSLARREVLNVGLSHFLISLALKAVLFPIAFFPTRPIKSMPQALTLPTSP